MNSLMDDNKVLTLASNERIPLKPYMRLIFEVDSMEYVTPASVSRGGVVYLSLETGSQWRNILGSWIRSQPDVLFDDADRERIQKIFDKYFPETLNFFRLNLKGIIEKNDVGLVTAVLHALNAMLNREIIVDETSLETTFVFCFVWGFGSFLSIGPDGTNYPQIFNDFVRSKFKTVKIPSRDTIFDYWLDTRTNKFESWKNSPAFKAVVFDSDRMNMSQIMIPTVETASVAFWVNLLVINGMNVMLAGPAGTGKTALVNGMLSNLKPDYHIGATVNMNYYTTAAVLLQNLEASLSKRTGSSYGPPGSAKQVFFLDGM